MHLAAPQVNLERLDQRLDRMYQAFVYNPKEARHRYRQGTVWEEGPKLSKSAVAAALGKPAQTEDFFRVLLDFLQACVTAVVHALPVA